MKSPSPASDNDPKSRAGFPPALADMSVSAASPIAMNEQIGAFLRDAISNGTLAPDTLLPTSRELAVALGVGRNTVVAAYSRLVAEGFLVAKVRRGTRVASIHKPIERPRTIASSPVQNQTVQSRTQPRFERFETNGPVEIGFAARRLLEHPATMQEGLLPFALGEPDPTFFPRTVIGRLLAEGMRTASLDAVTLGQAELARFQGAVAARVRQSRGVVCEPEQVIPTNGLEGAVDLVARLLIDPGHVVQIEDPSQDFIRAAFRGAGARLIALPSDTNGAAIGQVGGPPPRLIVVSPCISFPLGTQMSAQRQQEIARFAGETGAIVFENDVAGELLYRGSPIAALQASDPERVIYYGGLKNLVGPHMNTGYLIVPRGLVDPLVALVRRTGAWPEPLTLSALASFIEDGHCAMHRKRVRGAYAERLRLIVDACRRQIPLATIVEPLGGLHLTLRLPEWIDDIAVAETAAARGLRPTPLSRFYANPHGVSGLVLGIGPVPERAIDTLVEKLAEIVVHSTRDIAQESALRRSA
jgi:GntR family transcriptional regulator/MocR family aminotransferase